ncbi:MAG: hypothetical protein GF330_11755, partial [Candidatus Eisenbacteria bacterium]|nr:hypothetical protein [Candidatus Eisenbacteria bacterium]
MYGYGVYGRSSSAYGYLGGASTGVYGKDTGTEHLGELGTNDQGVYGEGPNEGVRGKNVDTEHYGILGTFLDGIYGFCDRTADNPIGAGIYAASPNGDGLHATSNNGLAAHVDGDLKVTGAYVGEIGPDNGAPFPRPAYDSG